MESKKKDKRRRRTARRATLLCTWYRRKSKGNARTRVSKGRTSDDNDNTTKENTIRFLLLSSCMLRLYSHSPRETSNYQPRPFHSLFLISMRKLRRLMQYRTILTLSFQLPSLSAISILGILKRGFTSCPCQRTSPSTCRRSCCASSSLRLRQQSC